MKILISGDLVPTDKNLSIFNNGNLIDLIGEELSYLWYEANFRVFNLETPLTDNEKPLKKHGPNLIAPTKAIHGIKLLKPSLITLANNHILDQGYEGLQSTIDTLSEHKIPYIGVGANLEDAKSPYIVDIENKRIGFYACADLEFSIATKNSPGANPFDPLESLDHIQELKNKCDIVIVLYHGGKEHYRYPTPYLQKICRKMVTKGADVVICQHSHCVGTFEQYGSGTIIYGQGNFIFNKYDNDYWNNSIIIKITLEEKIKVDYIPIVKTEKGIRLANLEESEHILNSFYQRSKDILEEDFIEKMFKKYANDNFEHYSRRILGMNKFISYLDRKILNGRLLKKIYNTDKLMALRNYMECEAHREIILESIKNKGD